MSWAGDTRAIAILTRIEVQICYFSYELGGGGRHILQSCNTVVCVSLVAIGCSN